MPGKVGLWQKKSVCKNNQKIKKWDKGKKKFVPGIYAYSHPRKKLKPPEFYLEKCR